VLMDCLYKTLLLLPGDANMLHKTPLLGIFRTREIRKYNRRYGDVCAPRSRLTRSSSSPRTAHGPPASTTSKPLPPLILPRTAYALSTTPVAAVGDIVFACIQRPLLASIFCNASRYDGHSATAPVTIHVAMLRWMTPRRAGGEELVKSIVRDHRTSRTGIHKLSNLSQLISTARRTEWTLPLMLATDDRFRTGLRCCWSTRTLRG